MITADRPQQDKDAHLPIQRIGGRYVTKYEPEIALQIVERVAQGETLRTICAKGSGFPHPVTFKRWVVNNPDLARALDAARKISAQSLEEEALDAAREIKRAQRDGTQVRAVDILLQQLRWSAERRDPAQFGTKAPVSIRVPISIHTTLDMGKVQGQVIDGTDVYKLAVRQDKSPETAIQATRQSPGGKPVLRGNPKWRKDPSPSPTSSEKEPLPEPQRPAKEA